MADKTTRKQKSPGRPFQPGQSGNPAGRPLGSRHKATVAVLTLLDGEAEALTRRAVEMALGGDTTAMRLCLERLAPPRREAPLSIDLPTFETLADLPRVTGAITQAVAGGELTPGEGQALASLVESHRKAVETADLAERVAVLESQQSKVRRKS